MSFSSFSSFHLIAITARAKGEKQISNTATDDEDLIVAIDDKMFPKLGSGRRIDSPAAFSGGRLHNLSKTIYYLTFLKGRIHTLTFESDRPEHTSVVEYVSISTLTLEETLSLNLSKQAEDGNNRPWITFVLDQLPLASIDFTLTYSRRKWDSDDVKMLIDGENQSDLLRSIKHFLWTFVGSLLPWSASTKTQTQTFTLHLEKGLHYIEFHADRMPTLNSVTFHFGKAPSLPARIPTVDNPQWTGSFYDDTEEMLLARLIFGEAENQSREAMEWVGGAVLNRVQAKAWKNTLHEVILQKGQYDPMKESDRNFKKIIDPLKNADKARADAWYESYDISRKLLSGDIKNPTTATHFHGIGVAREWFEAHIVPEGKFLKKIEDSSFYWSPN